MEEGAEIAVPKAIKEGLEIVKLKIEVECLDILVENMPWMELKHATV